MAIEKIKFSNWRKSHDRVKCNSGERIRVKYSGYYDDDGRLKIEPVGKEDTYELIQSFAQSVDINTILARFHSGDTDVLQRVQGFYFDATDLPKSTSELLNKLIYAENEFNKLPVDFKEKYGNDFARFICTFDPATLSNVVKDPQIVGKLPEDVKEVKSDES